MYAIFLWLLGIGSDMAPWNVPYLPYQIGSLPEIEQTVFELDNDLQIVGSIETVVCPITTVKKHIKQLSIYYLKSSETGMMSLYVNSPKETKFIKNTGEVYGKDFFVFMSDSLDCEPDDCYIALVQGIRAQCLTNSLGNLK